MIIIEFLIFCWKGLYYGIPGGLANGAPIFFKKVNFLNYPVDFGKTWRGKPIFGPHKTFRGLFFGILTAVLIIYIQRFLYLKSSYFRSISFPAYPEYSFVLFGFLVGFGILFGDLVESFIKRRLGKEPGKPWFPWDQLDCAVGSVLFLAIIYVPPWQVLVFIFVGVPLVHVICSHICYYAGIKDSKW